MHAYTAAIERCADAQLYLDHVPGFRGARSQGETLDELHANLQEVIAMLRNDGEPGREAEFVDTQTVVSAWMSGIPVLKPREVISVLLVPGSVEVRQRGSHKQFRHADGRSTMVIDQKLKGTALSNLSRYPEESTHHEAE